MSTKKQQPPHKGGTTANGRMSTLIQACDALVEEVKGLNLPPLSSVYTNMAQNEVANALIAHRIVSQYEVPVEADAAARKMQSIKDVIMRDAIQPRDTFRWRTLPPHLRARFIRAQNGLADFFRGFTLDYQLRFPTGETYVTASGETDLFFKLSQLEQWVVSPDLVDYCVEILLRNRSLLAVVKQRYRQKYGLRGMEILRDLRAHGAGTYDINTLRRKMVKFYFRATTTLGRVSRVTTVPKNNTEDRVISCEPLWNMICQLSYGASLRAQLKKRLGVDLTVTQNVHRALIRSGKATIDLSKASDLNLMSVLRALWPPKQYKLLERLRSGLFELPNGEIHPVAMFAPMGCGCTFEVMTLTLLMHARVFDPGASVFGDDIIIEKTSAGAFIDFIESMHWKVNVNKSFVDGDFRESCGAFCDLRSQTFYRSYDLPRPHDLPSLMLFAHKVLRLAYVSNGSLRSILLRNYAKMALLMPRDSFMVIDKRSLDFNQPLTDFVVYIPREWIGSLSSSPRSRAQRCLEKFWQRPIQLTHRHSVGYDRLEIQVVDTTATAAFLRRGTSYEPILRKALRVQVVERWTGTPLRGILMASVL